MSDPLEGLPEGLREHCQQLGDEFTAWADADPPKRPPKTTRAAYVEDVHAFEVQRLRWRPRPPGLDPPIHLLVLICGMSPEPLLLSAAYIEAKHLVVVGSDTSSGDGSIDDFLEYARHANLTVRRGGSIHAVDPAQAYVELAKVVREEMQRTGVDPSATAIDITGGKKTMVAAAFLVASELRLRTLYVDGEYHPVARRPRPCTAEVRVLRDPTVAFRLRDVDAAREAYRQGNHERAAGLLEDVARSLDSFEEASLPFQAADLRAAAVRARAYAAWDRADYRNAENGFAAPPTILRDLASDWGAEDGRLRRFAIQRKGERLLQFAADRLAWATRGEDQQERFLRAYSSCEVALDGLVMALLESKRWQPKGKPRTWQELRNGGSSDDELAAVLATGQSSANLRSENFSGLGDPYTKFSQPRLRGHRNDLVHKIASVNTSVVDELLAGSPSVAETLLLAVAKALGLGTGEAILREAIEASEPGELLNQS